MKRKIIIKTEYFYLIFISIFLLGCQGNIQESNDCSKFANETYKEFPDTSLAKAAFNYQKYLLEIFGEKSVKGLNYEAYHLLFHSSLGHGKSVKMENKNGYYSITVKCKTKDDLMPDYKEYEMEITGEEWNKLEQMIYEFDFWTEEDFRDNKNVLHEFGYILEGNRPEAKKCNKKAYKLVARGSPRYDKIGALCRYIIEYEDHFSFKYEQRNEIK